MARIVSDTEWWITATRHRVAGARHPQARQLLVGKGCEIDQQVLDSYPILPEREAKAVAAPPENKAIDGPWKGKKRA